MLLLGLFAQRRIIPLFPQSVGPWIAKTVSAGTSAPNVSLASSCTKASVWPTVQREPSPTSPTASVRDLLPCQNVPFKVFNRFLKRALSALWSLSTSIYQAIGITSVELISSPSAILQSEYLSFRSHFSYQSMELNVRIWEYEIPVGRDFLFQIGARAIKMSLQARTLSTCIVESLVVISPYQPPAGILWLFMLWGDANHIYCLFSLCCVQMSHCSKQFNTLGIYIFTRGIARCETFDKFCCVFIAVTVHCHCELSELKVHWPQHAIKSRYSTMDASVKIIWEV